MEAMRASTQGGGSRAQLGMQRGARRHKNRARWLRRPWAPGYEQGRGAGRKRTVDDNVVVACEPAALCEAKAGTECSGSSQYRQAHGERQAASAPKVEYHGRFLMVGVYCVWYTWIQSLWRMSTQACQRLGLRRCVHR